MKWNSPHLIKSSNYRNTLFIIIYNYAKEGDSCETLALNFIIKLSVYFFSFLLFLFILVTEIIPDERTDSRSYKRRHNKQP